MIRDVLTYPHPLLKERAKEITQVTPELRQLAANMAETMYEYDGIGLAAPQVGELIRLIVIDLSGPEKREDLRVFVNPKLELIGEEIESEEGCLSVEEYRNIVTRSSAVRLTATDLDGNPVDCVAEDLFAVCLQHECDHLEGKLFIDRISRLKRNLFDAKIKKRARQNNL